VNDERYTDSEAFHQAIYDACGNRFLAKQTEQLRNRLKPYRRMQLHVRHRVQGSLEEHQRIVDAIRAGDEARVDQLIKSHILIQGEKFHTLLRGLEEDPSESTANAG